MTTFKEIKKIVLFSVSIIIFYSINILLIPWYMKCVTCDFMINQFDYLFITAPIGIVIYNIVVLISYSIKTSTKTFYD